MSVSGVCQNGRHRVCGGNCSCSCHPGTEEGRAQAAESAVERFMLDLEELIGSAGKHEGHALSNAGRCVYCSCGQRYQGSLPTAKERRDCAASVAARRAA